MPPHQIAAHSGSRLQAQPAVHVKKERKACLLVDQTARCAVQDNPGVAVVEDLRDMFRVSQLQQLRKVGFPGCTLGKQAAACCVYAA